MKSKQQREQSIAIVICSMLGCGIVQRCNRRIQTRNVCVCDLCFFYASIDTFSRVSHWQNCPNVCTQQHVYCKATYKTEPKLNGSRASVFVYIHFSLSICGCVRTNIDHQTRCLCMAFVQREMPELNSKHVNSFTM